MEITIDWNAELTAARAGKQRREVYARYLSSAQWAATRAEALDRAEHACQLCNGTTGLQAHHRTYDRVGAERPADLVVLCERCHHHFHRPRDGRPYKPRPKEVAPAIAAAIDAAVAATPGERFTLGEVRARAKHRGELTRIVIRRHLELRAAEGVLIQISKNRFRRA